MGEKQIALSDLREQFDYWEALLASLSEAQITAPVLDDGWSLKDMIAHLHAWQLRSIARIEAASGDHAPRYPAWPEQFDPEVEGQPHDLNAWLYQQYHAQPWGTVQQQWRDGFRRFLALGEAVPADALVEQDRYPWLEGYALIAVLHGSCEHHREHAEFLQPFLPKLQQSP